MRDTRWRVPCSMATWSSSRSFGEMSDRTVILSEWAKCQRQANASLRVKQCASMAPFIRPASLDNLWILREDASSESSTVRGGGEPAFRPPEERRRRRRSRSNSRLRRRIRHLPRSVTPGWTSPVSPPPPFSCMPHPPSSNWNYSRDDEPSLSLGIDSRLG